MGSTLKNEEKWMPDNVLIQEPHDANENGDGPNIPYCYSSSADALTGANPREGKIWKKTNECCAEVGHEIKTSPNRSRDET